MSGGSGDLLEFSASVWGKIFRPPVEFGQGVCILIFTHTDEEVGVWKAGGVGSFPRTKRYVFNGTKIHLFGVEFLNFGATYLRLGAIYLNFWRHMFEFLGENRVFLRENREYRCVWVGAPGPPGGFVIGVGEKYSAHPLRLESDKAHQT